MRRRAVLLLLAAAACHHAKADAGLAAALFGLAKESGKYRQDELERAGQELLHLTELAREALAAAPERSPIAVTTELLFGKLGFVREVEDPSLDFVLLPGVLRHRRGGCVGLGTLLLCVAETLGWSAAGVLMPGHFYVRVSTRERHDNVELLHQGELMPDAWYLQRFPIPGGSAAEYARPLSRSEVLGVLQYNIGLDHRRASRLDAAGAAFSRAVAAFPDFAEAHASLGATEQLLGHLEAASASYRTALSKQPELPGVQQNLALLEQERQRQR